MVWPGRSCSGPAGDDDPLGPGAPRPADDGGPRHARHLGLSPGPGGAAGVRLRGRCHGGADRAWRPPEPVSMRNRSGRSSSGGWRSSRSARSPPAPGPGWSTCSTSWRRRGTKLGALSDYPAVAKLEALGIADRFDVVLSAQDPRVHAFKPNPKGLLVALEALAVEPARRRLRRRPGRGRRRRRGRRPACVACSSVVRDRRGPARPARRGDGPPNRWRRHDRDDHPRVPPTGGRRAVGPADAQGPLCDHASGPLVQAGLRPARHRRRAERLDRRRSLVGSGAGSSSGSLSVCLVCVEQLRDQRGARRAVGPLPPDQALPARARRARSTSRWPTSSGSRSMVVGVGLGFLDQRAARIHDARAVGDGLHLQHPADPLEGPAVPRRAVGVDQQPAAHARRLVHDRHRPPSPRRRCS